MIFIENNFLYSRIVEEKDKEDNFVSNFQFECKKECNTEIFFSLATDLKRT